MQSNVEKRRQEVMSTTTTTEQKTAVARTFVQHLRSMLTRDEWRALGDAQFTEPDANVCHSHDYCDANIVMATAFEEHDLDYRDSSLWNEVWTLAKPMMTRVPCPTVVNRETWKAGMDPKGPGIKELNVPCGGSLRTCDICGALRFCGREGNCLDAYQPNHVVRRLFSIESDFAEAGYPNGLPGWTRGERWNGWACPRFEKTEALALIAYQNTFEQQRAWYDEATDTFFLSVEGDTDEWKGEPLETPEGVITVYAIGAWAWIWDAAEPEGGAR
jgi:hypothetical protein